ncbi:acetyl-CoA carboxylase [Rhodovibrionaceae bacterium A322]
MSNNEVLSPLPGTFYRQSAPTEPPYKAEGDSVAEGEVIGLVEVMKSFHEIKATCSGTIARFLVENEAAVSAGQPLLEVAD